MDVNLTEQDRRVLKYEKRMGYVFCGIIISFGALINLIWFLVSKGNPQYLLIGSVDLMILGLAWLVCNRVNLKLNRDLTDGIKVLEKKTVEKKIDEPSYEAGSGALFIPILGNLFPKLWGQKMRETRKYFIITGNNRYEVDKDLYDTLKKDTDFYLHVAKHSETVLYFSKAE